ncbi:MAG: glycosyltransferase [Lentisphaeria bacterium]|nr:glycosyltransferase [Lentisphaeria bacterium]
MAGIFVREQALALHLRGLKVGVIGPTVFRPHLKTNTTKKTLPSVPFPELVPQLINWGFFIPGKLATVWEKNVTRLFSEYIATYGTPDIIHAHNMLYAGYAGMSLSKSYQIPLVLTEHHSRHFDNSFKFWQRGLVHRGLRQIDHGIAVSGHLKKAILSQVHCRSDKWTVVPNMVSDIFISRPITNLPVENEFRFITVGNLVPIKRQDLILKAIYQIKSECRLKVRLDIIGAGPENQQLKELVKAFHLEEIVRFRGPLNREALLDALDNSHALISASNFETFGLVICEAHARGKPVISTQSGGPNEIINIENGQLIPVNDVNSLVRAMEDMMTNYSAYDGEKIHQSAVNRFSPAKVTKQLLTYYEKILKN